MSASNRETLAAQALAIIKIQWDNLLVFIIFALGSSIFIN